MVYAADLFVVSISCGRGFVLGDSDVHSKIERIHWAYSIVHWEKDAPAVKVTAFQTPS
jgi:hypothetical protein